MRTVILISCLFAATLIIYLTVGKKAAPRGERAHAGTSPRSKDIKPKPSPYLSARERRSLDEKSKAQGSAAPSPDQPSVKTARSDNGENLNRALLEQVKALREEVAELRRRQRMMPEPSQGGPSETTRTRDQALEIDHNPEIPGIQQAGEGAGRRVLGDPQNTIAPGTPAYLIATDEATKAEAQRLTKAAEEAYENKRRAQ